MSSGRMNKRGGLWQDHMGDIIFMIIVVLIVVIMIINWKNNSESQYGELQSCNVIGIGNGICSAEDGDGCYDKLGNCPKEQSFCCISLEEKEKSILPAIYGGNINYDFSVGYIGPNTKLDTGTPPKNLPPTGCTFDNSYGTSMICPAGKPLLLPVKIEAINTGRAIITVKATPYYVFNDDPLRIVNVIGKTTLKLTGTSTATYKGEVVADINIAAKDAIAGEYIKIFPYALCDTRDCKREDSRGTLRTNIDPRVYMTVKFVDMAPKTPPTTPPTP